MIEIFSGAEKRSPRPPDEAFRIVDADLGGASRRSIEARQPSRITWSAAIPRHATLDVAIGVSAPDRHAGALVRFAVGMSDGRMYERLFSQAVPADGGGWIPVTIDLSRYAGFQWSLFYRPSSRSWQVIFGTTAENAGGNEAPALWGTPNIVGSR